MSSQSHDAHAWCAFIAMLLVGLWPAPVYADTAVDTAYQRWGIAPRIEIELGPQFAWGLGHACRDEPAQSSKTASSSCTSGFAMLGGQVLALVRPLNHWALGQLYAFDAVLGPHAVSVNASDSHKTASYTRSSHRLAVEVRWYSHAVATGGLYIAAHAGALWWTDKLEPVTGDGATQLAPELGLELGGVFAPYRGPGMSLGLQAWFAWLRNAAQSSSLERGSSYGYGPFVFVGLIGRFQLGVSL